MMANKENEVSAVVIGLFSVSRAVNFSNELHITHDEQGGFVQKNWHLTPHFVPSHTRDGHSLIVASSKRPTLIGKISKERAKRNSDG